MKRLFIPILLTAIAFGQAMAETALIIQPQTGPEQAEALAQIGYVKLTQDSLFVYSHSDILLAKNAIKSIRHIRYGEKADVITDLNSSQHSTCRVYPNPTQDILLIDNAEADNAYIFDLNGQLLMTAPINQGNTSVNVGNLPQGEYLLLLGSKTATTTQTYKFIKR